MKYGRGSTLLIALLGVAGIAQAADPVPEVEPNNPIATAQRVSGGGGAAAVAAVLGEVTGVSNGDVDFFTFFGQEGDVVTLDIDGGWGGERSVDTIMGVFGPGPGYALLRMNDDAPPDEGSIGWVDSRIEDFRVPATGYYIVGVSPYPHYFKDGGADLNPSRPFAAGDYELVISGASSAVQQINIEVKPGSGEFAPINLKSRGKIPVALLSSNEFNAMDVNVASLTFGATGDEASLRSCGRGGEDVNGDGRLDLVCHFENQKTGFASDTLEGILRGKTQGGQDFEGRGVLKVVPRK